MTDINLAKWRIEMGIRYPYDGAWKDGELQPLRHADDWEYIAARAIIYDIGDRAGLKHEWRLVDDDVRPTIVDDFAAIIRAARRAKPEDTQRPEGATPDPAVKRLVEACGQSADQLIEDLLVIACEHGFVPDDEFHAQVNDWREKSAAARSIMGK